MNKDLEDLLRNYSPSQESIQAVQQVTSILLVGISGAGKDTIKKALLQTGKYHNFLTTTTRAPRKNHGVLEQDGVDYHFIDFNTAQTFLKQKKYVEAKPYNNNIYGSTVDEFKIVARDDKINIADIDVRGVEEYMKIAPQSIKPIFILPPDFQTWESRFKVRYEGRVGEGEFHGRLHAAIAEIEHALEKNYYQFVINDDLDDTLKQVEAIAQGESQSEVNLRHAHQVAQELLAAMQETWHSLT